MSTLVTHTSTGKEYLLIGCGYGAFQPIGIISVLAESNGGRYPMICVCDREGNVQWFPSEEVNVRSVNGSPLENAFADLD